MMKEKNMKTHNYIFKALYKTILLIAFSTNLVFGQTTLKKVGKYNPGICYGLSIINHYAYTTTNKSLIILDIQNPEKPTKVAELEVGVPIFGLSVKNDYGFLAASDKGLIIVDISNPNDPKIVGEYNSRGTMARVEVVDNYCYTINQEHGIEIIDISEPTKPQKVGSFQITARALSIQDNIAFVSDPINGLTVLDISSPGNIKKLNIVDNTIGAAGISVNNGMLYLGSYNNWVSVYNISEPRSPKFLTRYTYPDEVSDLIMTDKYLITNFQGITIKDITDVRNPILYAEYHVRGIKGGVHDIVVQNNYIYFALKGITVLRIEKD
jgi:hypothetical protein